MQDNKMQDLGERAVVDAYRASHEAMLGPDAAYRSADAVYRAQHPEIDQQTARDHVASIVAKAVLAAKGRFWLTRK